MDGRGITNEVCLSTPIILMKYAFLMKGQIGIRYHR